MPPHVSAWCQNQRTLGPIVVFQMISEPNPRLHQRHPLTSDSGRINPTRNPKEVVEWMGNDVLHCKLQGGLPAQREPLKCEQCLSSVSLGRHTIRQPGLTS